MVYTSLSTFLFSFFCFLIKKTMNIKHGLCKFYPHFCFLIKKTTTLKNQIYYTENLPSDVIKIEMLLKPRDPFICDMARDCL